MNAEPSDRIVDQRLRNRIMNVVETLADGDEGVRQASFKEYFESFYDLIPHHQDGPMRDNSSVTSEERTILIEVRKILDAACDGTPNFMTEEEFIGTGWPSKIRPVALSALKIMRARGRLSEEKEEQAPSGVAKI